MNALLKAELLRLASRRLLVVTLVLMAALAAIAALAGAGSVQPPSEQELEWAESSYQQEVQDWEEACGVDPVEPVCTDWPEPVLDTIDWRNLGFGQYAREVLDFGFPLVLVAVAVLAASLIGAEFASGNIGTQLVFTPRRVPVMAAKVVAGAVAGVLVAAAFVGASLALSAITFLALRGAHDMSAGTGLPLLIGRVMVLSLILAVMSGALAIALGSALATMAAFVLVAVGSMTLGTALRGENWLHLVLPTNILQAMMNGRFETYNWDDAALDAVGPDGMLLPVQIIHYDWALGYSVIGTVLIIAVAGWYFGRRDILD